MKHREIRTAVLSALKDNISERVSWFDGRPVFIDEQELPAVAVYLT
ncbi:TPA: phage tail protein, partial [Escherichia coli]